MPDERQQRLLQESLDEQLTSETMQSLRDTLEQDQELRTQYNRLKRVDEMLRSAPMERAPARLALGIIARLAQQVEAQQKSKSSSLAMALGMAAVVLLALPLLAAAMALFLAAMGSAQGLANVLQQMTNLLGLVVAMLDAIVRGAQTIMAEQPQAPLLLVTVVPLIAFWLLRTLRTPPTDPNENDAQP